jgi:hypothetical protein
MPRTTVSPSYLTSLKWGDAATNSSIPTSRTTRRPNVKRYIFLFLGHAEGYRSSTDAASPRGHVLNGVSRKDLDGTVCLPANPTADWRTLAATVSFDIQSTVRLPEGNGLQACV